MRALYRVLAVVVIFSILWGARLWLIRRPFCEDVIARGVTIRLFSDDLPLPPSEVLYEIAEDGRPITDRGFIIGNRYHSGKEWLWQCKLQKYVSSDGKVVGIAYSDSPNLIRVLYDSDSRVSWPVGGEGIDIYRVARQLMAKLRDNPANQNLALLGE